jgi:hypothetical protein
MVEKIWKTGPGNPSLFSSLITGTSASRTLPTSGVCSAGYNGVTVDQEVKM